MERKEFRILVADDDEIARDVMSALLSREGYPVVTAVDGLDAIRLLTIDEVSLVITDLRMPGSDGIEVLKHALLSNPDVAVILVTAYGTLDTALEAIKQGAFDYLTKPFRIQEILFAVEKALAKLQMVQENRELRRHLRDTYRDLEVVKAVANADNHEITAAWLSRMERLAVKKVLPYDEIAILRKKLVGGNGRG